ncbi:MAG TPA: MarR family transcriptional regulator [Yinghuangia sp.]|uniref:MarR family winged helix-turn-helix transcriptional regulator n=1 Tax=Yinghuangia sp. YIM S10712 TaxID=3436930 RepID=UPI002BBB12DF|nr:MarR family transcriptional regulator [Yinghuangia sp.]
MTRDTADDAAANAADGTDAYAADDAAEADAGAGPAPGGRRLPDVRYAEQARERLAVLAPAADPGDFALGYHLLHLAYMLVTDLESHVHRPRGWTVPGFRVMFKLWVLGPTRPSRLAELSVMSRSALTNAVNTLARADLVERRQAPGDRRGVVIALTERGRTAVAEAFAAHAARESAWFADLSPTERDQLTALLGRLVATRPTAS